MAQEQPQPWHSLEADQIAALLKVDLKTGLDPAEVRRRLEEYGPNEIPAREGLGPVMRFLLQFHQPLIYILLAAAAVTLFLHEFEESVVIFAVVLVNAIIGFVQESRAIEALEALSRTMQTQAIVVREGRRQEVPSTELVPGDVVVLQSGDKVPADLRFFRVKDLQTAEAALTGESAPVEKHTETVDANTPLAERTNVGYSSTLVTYGQATGVVVATGGHTEVGRISELISTADQLETPLTRKISEFSHWLLYAILALAALTFIIGWAQGTKTFNEIFMESVALAVGAIPEGLPAAVTILLAIGVNRMAQRGAIIRNLPAVETLGSVTVICSDKTGTLTENQMTVREIWAGGRSYDATGVGFAPEGEVRHNDERIERADEHEPLLATLRAGLLCNDSVLREEEGRWDVQGDPTEGALLAVGPKLGLAHSELQERHPRVDAVPFESQHQYMATMHAREGAPHVVYLKGAVERILERCEYMLSAEGRRKPIDRDTINHQFEQMAAKGLRVLAFASSEKDAGHDQLNHDDLRGGLTFLGLQGMIDPPREASRQAVQVCQRAGIQVKMITGDHGLTARAIAEQLNLGRMPGSDASRQVEAITGAELSELNDEEFVEAANRASVFARVTPEQKLLLVRSLQARGHVAAMTGDGVNDAPALKQADIGVAMGVAGTEVAKESADMVLTDDNFATIEAAVEEGRGVFDNLTKFIVWTIPTNLGEGLVILAAVLLGTTLPIQPVQILWINMTTAVLLGLMLAFEPKEPGIMERAPREPSSPILDTPLIMRTGLVGLLLLAGAFGLFYWSYYYNDSGVETADQALVAAVGPAIPGEGAEPEAEKRRREFAQTVAVNVFVFVEVFYLFNCRSLTHSMFHLGLFTNPWIWFGIGATTVLQLIFTYVPVMNRLFHSEPIGWLEWSMILGVSFAAYLIVEFEKWVRREVASPAGAPSG